MIQTNFRLRKSFGKFNNLIPVPNLLKTQKDSFRKFLMAKQDASTSGLFKLFKTIFPVTSHDGMIVVEFLGFKLGEPRYDVDECRYRGASYALPLTVEFQLIINEKIPNSDKLQPKEIRTQNVYFGEIHQMTDEGTFVVNGTERVVVSQLHRSPGLSYIKESSSVLSRAVNYQAKIIPAVGSWLVFEFDSKEFCYVQIDTKRKLYVTTLLKALGYSSENIIEHFYEPEHIRLEKGRDPETGKDQVKLFRKISFERLTGRKVSHEFRHPKTGELILKPFARLNKRNIKKIQEANITELPIEETSVSFFAYSNITTPKGALLKSVGEEITTDDVEEIFKSGIKEFEIIFLDKIYSGPYIKDTLNADKVDDLALKDIALCALNKVKDEDHEELCSFFQFKEPEEKEEFYELCRRFATSPTINIEIKSRLLKIVFQRLGAERFREEVRRQALREIFRRMRPNEPATYKDAESFLHDMLFLPTRYDLSEVGRLKLNNKLRKEVPLSTRTLIKEDILDAVKYLMDIKNNGLNGAKTDDIDHLSNRRVRAVGELVENEFKKGLLKIKKGIEEKMLSVSDVEMMNPHELINPKPLHATLNEFFGSSQLSQFMDQTNPLSEITHKRRLSALGPSGLKRERAGYEVRDVHATHYGRICPIETPEGQNIGLISSLAVFTEINDYGFLETPYRKVVEGVVTDDYKYLSAIQEEGRIIAQAEVAMNKKTKKIIHDHVYARKDGDFLYIRPQEVEWMDVSTYQMVSVAASMIPFLQNDDANRALMGSNMQRQAVPLVNTEAPLIGTGMEERVGKDSGAVVIARRDGVVEFVDAARIVVRADETVDVEETEADIYNISKYRRSNQNTCVNQIPVVRKGERVKTGDVLADGPSTDMGEIALGRNILVAFMPWQGYNYEDAILISERVVKEDIFTSIHIEEEEVFARDVKLGPETITRDVPGAKEEKLSKLDESGIIRIGAKVTQDDILVGKITPRAEQQLTPEERLLRAIFGSKADDVKDTSLRVPTGISGTVIDVKIFTRKGVEKDQRALEIEKQEEQRLKKDSADQKKIIRNNAHARIRELVIGKECSETLFDQHANRVVSKGGFFEDLHFKGLTFDLYQNVRVIDKEVNKKIKTILANLTKKLKHIDRIFFKKIETISRGDELSPGVRKMIKIILAIKRKLQVGDKMSGRHGNKGVVSRILKEEDLPYLPDGKPVEMVLNPLGVPSRMNIGQILEVHLGWAARGLGEKLLTMYEEKAPFAEIKSFLYDVFEKPEEKIYVDALTEDKLELFVNKHKNGFFFANPVFDGISEEEIREKLVLAGLPEKGQVALFDGRTGESFDQEITVGIMYILKLHHLVDEKIHARSTGPYSLVTQQPLGGKAQFGGQRLGEMEVWALEAYGAAHVLKEFLTVKSDDITGRDKMYEAIVKGDNILRANAPEAFNVLLKELEALCLKVNKLDDDGIQFFEDSRREKLSEIMD